MSTRTVRNERAYRDGEIGAITYHKNIIAERNKEIFSLKQRLRAADQHVRALQDRCIEAEKALDISRAIAVCLRCNGPNGDKQSS